jgi:uncharacterized membrane protein (DUF485 family)
MPEILKPDLTDRSAWDRVAESQHFKDLMAIKRTFIVPACLFLWSITFCFPSWLDTPRDSWL